MITLLAFKAVIFDMDGLLLDTETISENTFMQACETFGVVVGVEDYRPIIGTNDQGTKDLLIPVFPLGFPYDDLRTEWVRLYDIETKTKPVPLMAGTRELLDHLQANNIPMCVATSSKYADAIIKLTNANLIDYFDFIIGGDQVAHGKPAPDIYLKAINRLQVGENCVFDTPNPASEILIFEDSNNGTLAAHLAGASVIQVPNLVEPSPEIRAIGHQITDSLKNLLS